MKYGIFTQYQYWWDFYCKQIINAGRYKGYKTLPMIEWTRDRIILQDGTDIRWINTKWDCYNKICGLRLDRIYVVERLSPEEMLLINLSWNGYLS